MAEQKNNEAWVGGVALSTAVIAVFAAVTTLYVGKYSSRAVLFKAEESNPRAGDFGYGLIFLQISIMLSSVAALTKKRMLWYFGLASVLGGGFFFLDGIFLFH